MANQKSEAPSTPIPGMPDPEAALREIQNAEVAQTGAPAAPNPLAAEEYVFVVERTDPTGTKRRGEFKNRILSIEQRLNISLLQAKLTRNTPWDAIDPEGQYLTTVIAHLTMSLTEKPAWFSVAMNDVKLLNMIYAEVAKHEAFFRGD